MNENEDQQGESSEEVVVIPPTLGRVVWYRPADGEIVPSKNGYCTALITEVHSDEIVNLTVFDANGVQHSKTSVGLVQDDQDIAVCDAGYATWTPYQKSRPAMDGKVNKLSDVMDQLESDEDRGESPVTSEDSVVVDDDNADTGEAELAESTEATAAAAPENDAGESDDAESGDGSAAAAAPAGGAAA